MEGLIFPSGIGFVLSARSETTSTAGIEPGLLEETDGYGSRVVPKINKQLVLIGPPGTLPSAGVSYRPPVTFGL